MLHSDISYHEFLCEWSDSNTVNMFVGIRKRICALIEAKMWRHSGVLKCIGLWEWLCGHLCYITTGKARAVGATHRTILGYVTIPALSSC